MRVYHYSTRYISLLGCRANRHPHAEQGCPSKLCDIYSQKKLPISDFPNPHCIKSYLYRTCRTFHYEVVKERIYNNQDNVIALYYSLHYLFMSYLPLSANNYLVFLTFIFIRANIISIFHNVFLSNSNLTVYIPVWIIYYSFKNSYLCPFQIGFFPIIIPLSFIV